MTDERISVDGAPPCPVCNGKVETVLLERKGRTPLFVNPRLEPCGHAVASVHYVSPGIGRKDHEREGWSWVPYDDLLQTIWDSAKEDFTARTQGPKWGLSGHLKKLPAG